MSDSTKVKIVVFVPIAAADRVRDAMGNVGAGRIGNYSHCTYSSVGRGRFRPLEGAKPTIGEVGKLECVKEERIETICERKNLSKVAKAIKDAHPYEEVALDVYPLLNGEIN